MYHALLAHPNLDIERKHKASGKPICGIKFNSNELGVPQKNNCPLCIQCNMRRPFFLRSNRDLSELEPLESWACDMIGPFATCGYEAF